MKNIKKMMVFMLLFAFTITTVYAAASVSGSFTLAWAESSTSSKANLKYTTPYVKYDTTKGSSTVDIILTYSPILGSNKDVQRKEGVILHEGWSTTSDLNKVKTGRYYERTYNDGDEKVSASYLFSSK